MTPERPFHDPSLRELLDAAGLVPGDPTWTEAELTETERARAQQMLNRVLADPRVQAQAPSVGRGSQDRADSRRETAPRRRMGIRVALAAVLAVLVSTLGTLFWPSGSGLVAHAHTPPLLRFSGVEVGAALPHGVPAGRVLEDLADRARRLPSPADLPVQNIELDSWWSSSAPADAATPARSVLIPVRASHYVFPGGDFRSIEKRGRPLNENGQIVDDPEWDRSESDSDVTFAMDPAYGPEFPASLPGTPAALLEALAPQADCAENRAECLMSEFINLHTTYVLEPGLIANLWTAMREMPEIVYIGETTDRLGRPAVALSSPTLGEGIRVLLLADPDTGAFVGAEHVLIEENPGYGFEPPAVVSFTALVDSRRISESEVPDNSTTERF